ncbi:oligosaccharide flippase family protein [Candidatus Nomurabacteria bacterium]|nr:oligosaccharide flippase family protein [Candidatus Nomurabacteria bacterium]
MSLKINLKSILRDNSINYTLKNTSLAIVGKTIIFIFGFLLMKAFSHFTSKETIGLYNYVIAVLTIISITTLPGTTSALVRAISNGKEGSFLHMTNARLRGGIFAFILSFCIGIFYIIKGNNTIGYVFFVGALCTPFIDTLSEMAFAYWQGKKNFKKSIYLSIIYQILFTIPSILVLIFIKKTILLISLIFLFQALSGFLIYKTISTENKERDIESENFSLHLTIVNGLHTIGMTIDRIIIWHLFGSISLAIYTFAIIPITKLEQLIPIEFLSLPHLSNQIKITNNKKDINEKTLLLFIILIPFILFGWFIAPLFYKIIFPNFPESIHLFRILLLLPLCAFFSLPKTALIAWKQQEKLYYLEFFSILIKIPTLIFFGLKFGMTGIAEGLVISRIIEGIMIVYLFNKVKIKNEN